MSTSNKSFLTSAIIRTKIVGTVGIHMAVLTANTAFIDIYNNKGYIRHTPRSAFRELKSSGCYDTKLTQFTWTRKSISSEPFFANTAMRTNGVGTVCIQVAFMASIAAFIDIYNKSRHTQNKPFKRFQFISPKSSFRLVQNVKANLPEHECPSPANPSLQVQL